MVHNNLKLVTFIIIIISYLIINFFKGNSPPAMVPNKGIYMAQDLRRLQKYFEVPLIIPEVNCAFISL